MTMYTVFNLAIKLYTNLDTDLQKCNLMKLCNGFNFDCIFCLYFQAFEVFKNYSYVNKIVLLKVWTFKKIQPLLLQFGAIISNFPIFYTDFLRDLLTKQLQDRNIKIVTAARLRFS